MQLVRLELSSVSESVGLGLVALFLGWLLIDGIVMLLSPRRWFQLPGYVGLHGSMRRNMLTTLSGRLRIRLLGLAAAAAAIYFGAVVLGKGATGKPPLASLFASYDARHILLVALGISTGLGVAAYGFAWLVGPRWYLDRCWRPRAPETRPVAEGTLTWVVRTSGAIAVAIGAYVLWTVIKGWFHS
jgi:hypothetical protein